MGTTGVNGKSLPDQLNEGVKKRLMRYPNVTDVGIGAKMKDGKFTFETSVIVYVKKKLPKNQLTTKNLIPKKINNIPIDVQEELEVGYFRAGDTTDFNLNRVRPLRSGLAVSSSSAPDHAGTLGCFATRNTDKKKVLISNYHVLFRNKGLPGINEGEHKVYQPLQEEHNLVAKVPETSAGSIGGSVDCAYAVLEEEGSSCCCKHVIAHENKVGTIQLGGVATAQMEQKVFKTGIATRSTVGRVVNVSKAINGPLDYAEYNLPAGESFTFSNLIMIVYWDEAANAYDDSKEFSSGGDSGSAVYNENNEIIGIHFGSHFNPTTGRHFSFACHVELVENQLGITIPGTRNYTAASPPPPSPAVAVLDLPISSDEGVFIPAGSAAEVPDFDNFWPSFKDRLQKTELGRTALHIISLHGFEIMRLINRNREVTVTWHRRQGPAFTAAIARSIKYSKYRIPAEIQGHSANDMLSQMGKVLHLHGSEELRNAIDEHLPMVLRIAESMALQATFSELIEQLDSIQLHQFNPNQNA